MCRPKSRPFREDESSKRRLTRGRGAMKMFACIVATAAVLLGTTPTRASMPRMVTGGGTGTFNADLDGDGDIDGSHFGFAVLEGPGASARGHFMCQMAGNADFLGLKLMLVEGRVSLTPFT